MPTPVIFVVEALPEIREVAVGALVSAGFRVLAMPTLDDPEHQIGNAEASEAVQGPADRPRDEPSALALTGRLFRLQEDELRRLARDLHDVMGQQIAVLLLELIRLEDRLPIDDDGRDIVRTIRHSVSRLANEVHRTARALRPPALDDLGLRPALAQITEDWRRSTGIACAFEWRLTATSRLPSDVETVIYRAVQEALTNVQKHARAPLVSVAVAGNADDLEVIIEDSGIGFDVEFVLANAARRLGLVGMRERLSLVGGTLTIQSAPGRGTALRLHIPLTRTQP